MKSPCEHTLKTSKLLFGKDDDGRQVRHDRSEGQTFQET